MSDKTEKSRKVGRPRKIPSPEALSKLWEQYKTECDNQQVLTHNFSARNESYVSANLRRSITYTLEGLCVFVGISRQAFHEYYASDPRYVDVVTCIREECELDARKKFETGAIPTQLAGLWMSRHGYSLKTESELTGKDGAPLQVVFGGEVPE